MRILATLAIAAGLALGSAAPASAEETPFPVCHHIYMNGNWFGAVCVNPEHRCIVGGGGYVWNACVVNPIPILAPIIP